MHKPTVHLNGTSRGALRLGYLGALNELRRTIEVVQMTAPNARDYYPQGDGAYNAAAAEHASRIRRLIEVQAELMELLEHVR